MDTLTRQQRSELMGRIRACDTSPEIAVRRMLFARGYRYRLHAPDLPGRPDVVLRGKRIAIFIHGCFWHRHNCGRAYQPKTRPEFWRKKFDRNVERDKTTAKALKALGWRIAIVWECELSYSQRVARRLERLINQ